MLFRMQNTDSHQSLRVISKNPQKFRDIKLATTSLSVTWKEFEPSEYQASNRLNDLRLQGESKYPQVARESALQKFDLITKDLPELQPGDTIVDSTLWMPCLDGLPGLNAAQTFASARMPDGTLNRSEAALQMHCKAAQEARDRRVYWIETAVTAELQQDGRIGPRVRQSIDICYITETPHPKGTGMWPITCANPLKVAAMRRDFFALEELQLIQDTKWELPSRAAKLGGLMCFAELSRAEVVQSSPRGELFRLWQEK
jgi:hypothetical protein